jgi:hypothetical protein
MVVLSVSAGVEPPELEPAKPFAEATEIEETPVPEGAAQVPSARRKFVVPPPDAGTRPWRTEVKVFSIPVTVATERSEGVAEPPVLLPFSVCVAIAARLAFEIAAVPVRSEFVIRPAAIAAVEIMRQRRIFFSIRTPPIGLRPRLPPA